jgi:DNA helicase HerA-like ATPase
VAAAWFLGVTGGGKTYLANELARAEAARNGFPLLIFDPTHDEKFADVPRAETVHDVVARVFARGDHCATTIDDELQADAIFAAVLKCGHVNLIVDEAPDYIHGKKCPLVRILRQHRHLHSSVFLTTQHLTGDVPAAAIACGPVLYVFRTTSKPALDRLESEYGLDRERARTLGEGEHVELRTGF